MNILQQHLFYTDKDPKNYLFINIGISLPIITWKLTKNCSYIIRNGLLSSYSFYSGNNQRSKLDVESSCIPVNCIELFYRLIRRLLFTSETTRPDVIDCVTYILIMIELPTNSCKNRNLNTDLLFTKKTHICIVTYKRLIYLFQNAVFKTQELYTNHTTTDLPITKIRKYIYRFEKSSQKYDQMDK